MAATTTSLGHLGPVVGLVLALSGCASTTDQRPSPKPETFNAARAHESVDDSISSRRRLPDLNETSGLPDYIAYAALNNPGLEAAFNRWKAALERAPQAGALPDPRFNYGYFIREVETRVGPQQQRLGVAQMLPWLGKRDLRETAATQTAEATRQHYEAAKLRLFDEVKQAYFELYFLGRAIAVTTENLELLQYLEQLARAKYESGTALHADVLKAQVELDKLRDCSVVLSALAHVTSSNAGEVEKAFRTGAPHLGAKTDGLQLLLRKECGLEPLDTALDRFALAAPQIKRNLIEACVQVVGADGLIQEREAELLRAIADTLDCPIPLFAEIAES